MSHLPSPRPSTPAPRDAAAPAALETGALAAAPLALVLGGLPAATWTGQYNLRKLAALVAPGWLATYLSRAAWLALPLLAALPVALLVQRLVARLAAHDRRAARAAAAGAGMASVPVIAWVLLQEVAPSGAALAALSPLAVPGCLGVTGLVGLLAFRGLPPAPGEDPASGVPALYPALALGGLATPAWMIAGGFAQTALAALGLIRVGIQPPEALTFLASLPGQLLGQLTLVPVTACLAYGLGRWLPATRRQTVSRGLAWPWVAVGLSYTLQILYYGLRYGAWQAGFEAAVVVAALAGAVAHGWVAGRAFERAAGAPPANPEELPSSPEDAPSP